MPVAAITLRVRVDDLSDAVAAQQSAEHALPLNVGLVSSSCAMDEVPWRVTGVDVETGQVFNEIVEAQTDSDAVIQVGSGTRIVTDAVIVGSSAGVGS